MSLLHPQSRIFCGILAGRAMCMNDASLTWMMKFIILCKFFFYGAPTYLISTEGIILMFTTELVLDQSEHDLLFSQICQKICIEEATLDRKYAISMPPLCSNRLSDLQCKSIPPTTPGTADTVSSSTAWHICRLCHNWWKFSSENSYANSVYKLRQRKRLYRIATWKNK